MGCYDFFARGASATTTLLDDLSFTVPLPRGVYPSITANRFQSLNSQHTLSDCSPLTEKMVLNRHAPATSDHAT
jgi:hypothetical protein